MVIQKKLQTLRDYFGIWQPDDWSRVEPRDVLSQDGIGPATLDHLRIYLAARGLTLHNDRTPEYWQENLSAAKIGDQLGDLDEGEDASLISPFTILVDTAETQPFTFQGIRADSSDESRPWIVKTELRSLGRHPDSLGDYSIDGYIGRCHVERKSLPDCQSTILGFGGRRERFEQELLNLSNIERAAVVVEASYLDVIQRAPETSHKSRDQNAKTLMRSILAYQSDYRVPWIFAGDRRMAELATFRFFERFWKRQQKGRKQMERMVAAL